MLKAMMLMLLAAISTSASPVEPDAASRATLPAFSREWHGADYQQLAEAIANGVTPLPRLSSKSGEAALKRITAVENLSFQKNRSLPIESRLQDFFAMQGALSSIGKRYFEAANSGQNLHSELAALLAFMLRMGASGVELLGEYVPTIPRDDNYHAKMQGLSMVRSGVTNIFVGAERTLAEKSFYTAEDLSLLMEAMADSLPSMKALFAPDFRVELRQKLEGHKKAASRPDDIRNLNRMLAALET